MRLDPPLVAAVHDGSPPPLILYVPLEGAVQPLSQRHFPRHFACCWASRAARLPLLSHARLGGKTPLLPLPTRGGMRAPSGFTVRFPAGVFLPRRHSCPLCFRKFTNAAPAKLLGRGLSRASRRAQEPAAVALVQRRPELRGRKVKQPCSLAFTECTFDSSRHSGRQGRSRLRHGRLHAKVPSRGDVQLETSGHGCDVGSLQRPADRDPWL